MHLHLAATATFLALALAAPNPPAPSSAVPARNPTGTPNPKKFVPPAIFSSKTPHCSNKDDDIIPDDKGVKGNSVIGTCQGFKPMSDNILLFFGEMDSVATAITLYTDQNCKNVGKVGALKKPGNKNYTCVHPSNFGGETWGSVMQTEGNAWWNP